MTQLSIPQAGLVDIKKTAEFIKAGKTMVISGDESLLKDLPKGNWIGGTIPYFMVESGGIISREQVFVHFLPSQICRTTIANYSTTRLPQVLIDAPEHGFSIIILPAGSNIHADYAYNAPDYEDMFLKPIIGWVSGVHLDELEQSQAKVFNGQTNTVFVQEAVVLHAELPESLTATIGIVNLFKQGQGDTFLFPETGFNVENCFINGKETNFADYLLNNKIDTTLPLVADYNGAMINVSFQSVNEDQHRVGFYAPIFTDIEYKLAASVPDYVHSFQAALPNNLNNVVFSCNCILNFLYSNLEGKRVGTFFGPMTFGEVAYQLLNQTLVYLTLDEY